MKPLPCLWSQSVAMSYRRNPCRRNNWFPDRRRYGGRNSDQQPQLQPAPPPPPPRRRRPQYSTVPPRPPSGTDYGPFSSYPYSLSPILRGPWKGPRPCINSTFSFPFPYI
ncbi:hypothetical protein TorRG33x02_313540 [Trema orientale]|uniref:Uncharacterized protein n=1 Tax=Trema orientale TaxID=63057 RepID=A0A2P5BPL2_TREOI|nr:hypothetical protein TorRG33x02_313540 [Trema orientale]